MLEMNSEMKIVNVPRMFRYGDYIINAERVESVKFNKTYGANIFLIGCKTPYWCPNEVAEIWFSHVMDFKKEQK